MRTQAPEVEQAAGPSGGGTTVTDSSMGRLLADTRSLTADQIEKILALQREKGLRFGEAAVSLGYASHDDVMYALAQQFHYPFAPAERRGVNPELVMLNKPFGAQAEGIRAIRSQLMMRLFNEPDQGRALAVVSPQSGDGKTFFAANLAVALAQLAGGRTLLVDADMRGPRQHAVFGVENSHGLSSILSGRAEGRSIQQVNGVPGLYLLPVGVTPPNPLELVERPAFAMLMRELSAKFDRVIVDTPAAVFGSDAGVISSRCGAALVVARKNKGRVDALQSLVANLSDTTARVVGVVYNEF